MQSINLDQTEDPVVVVLQNGRRGICFLYLFGKGDVWKEIVVFESLSGSPQQM